MPTRPRPDTAPGSNGGDNDSDTATTYGGGYNDGSDSEQNNDNDGSDSGSTPCGCGSPAAPGNPGATGTGDYGDGTRGDGNGSDSSSSSSGRGSRGPGPGRAGGARGRGGTSGGGSGGGGNGGGGNGGGNDGDSGGNGGGGPPGDGTDGRGGGPGSGPGGAPGGTGSGGGGNGGGVGNDGDEGGIGGRPIVLDLDGDGVELMSLDESSAFYDINGDGYLYNLGWAGSDDGLLAYDKDGDNDITARDEISFVDYVAGARTDLEGLRHFDSNADGVLDAKDVEFAKFKVWQDVDQDGEVDAGELRSLTDAGVKSIALAYAAGDDGIAEERDGNTIFGEGQYIKTDGTTGVFADAAFAVSDVGYREDGDDLMFKTADAEGKIYVVPDDASAGLNMDFAAAVQRRTHRRVRRRACGYIKWQRRGARFTAVGRCRRRYAYRRRRQ